MEDKMSKTKTRHTPVELVDITTLTNEEWLQWRKQGIGGSDLAAIMGLSPWACTRDVYYDKLGIPRANKDADNDNHLAKIMGHILEGAVAKKLSQKTGLKYYPVRKMFAHPDYPFMLANTDFFADLPDGRTAIIECKTADYRLKDKWADGVIPINYELQGRHYMCVVDVDVVFYGVLFVDRDALAALAALGDEKGLTEEQIDERSTLLASLFTDNNFEWRRIERDMDYEQSIIEVEEDFWVNHVQAGVEPPYIEKGDLVLKSIADFYGNPDTAISAVILPDTMYGDISEYLALKTQKSEAEKAVKLLDEKLKKAQAVFMEAIGAATTATCTRNGDVITINNKPQFRDSVDKDQLLALYPDVHAEVVTKKEIAPRLSVKEKKGA